MAEDVNEDGTLKPAALEAAALASGGQGLLGEPMPEPLLEPEPDLELEPDEEDFLEEEGLAVARRRLSGMDLNGEVKTTEDDVD